MLPEFGVSPRFSFQLPRSGGARGLKSGAANDGGFRTALSPLHLDSRLRGNDKWDVQRGEAPLRFFSSPKNGGSGG